MLPLRYRKDAPYNVSFSWEDIRDGTGYSVFYGGSMAGTTYTSPNTFYSGMRHKNGAEVTLTTEDTYYELLDFDFDIIFNRAVNLFGDFLVTVPFGISKVDATADDFFIKCTVDVYHYDGTTETQIGSTATSEEAWKDELSGVGAVFSHISTLVVNAAARVHFKSGDTLRFTIKVYGQCTDAAGKKLRGGIGCDPLNRSDEVFYNQIAVPHTDNDGYQVIETDEPTQLKFQVPFKTTP